jgi:mono/diheme cytochrome c family protein
MALMMTGCATPQLAWPPTPAYSAEALRGQSLARARCAGCHTVGLDDGGASEGPKFRTLAGRYNALALRQRFAEVSEHGSGMMAPITFDARDAEDLIAYVTSLPAD